MQFCFVFYHHHHHIHTCTSCSKYFSTSSLDKPSSRCTASLLTISSAKSILNSSRATVKSSSLESKFPRSQWTSSTTLLFIQSTLRRKCGRLEAYWTLSCRNLLRQALLVLRTVDGDLRLTVSADGSWWDVTVREEESMIDEAVGADEEGAWPESSDLTGERPEVGLPGLSLWLKVFGRTTGKL